MLHDNTQFTETATSRKTLAGIVLKMVFVSIAAPVLLTYAWPFLLSYLDYAIYRIAPKFWSTIGMPGLVAECLYAGVLFVLIWAVILNRRWRSLAALGWIREHLWLNGAWGLLIGISAYCSYIVIIWLGHWYRIVGHHAWTNIVVSMLFTLLIALCEETLARGFLFVQWEARQGTGRALLISSLVFGTIHLREGNPFIAWHTGHFTLYAVYVVRILVLKCTLGMLFGAAYLFTRSLWTAVGCHWAWDWMNYVFGDHSLGNNFFYTRYKPEAFTLTGAGLWIDVAIGWVTAGLLLWIANRRGHWRKPPSASPPMPSIVA